MTRVLLVGKVALAHLAAVGVLLIAPSPAFADNCSSLSDCWSTAAGAASAAAGAAFGALGGLFGGGSSDGGFTGRGAGGRWPAPSPTAPSAPPGDHYPFPGPGEPTGEDAAKKRVRDYYRDVRVGRRSPRTVDDAWEDLERVAPKLDLDEETQKYYEETVRKFPTDPAIRG